jgi:hypothetical protein
LQGLLPDVRLSPRQTQAPLQETRGHQPRSRRGVTRNHGHAGRAGGQQRGGCGGCSCGGAFESGFDLGRPQPEQGDEGSGVPERPAGEARHVAQAHAGAGGGAAPAGGGHAPTGGGGARPPGPSRSAAAAAAAAQPPPAAAAAVTQHVSRSEDEARTPAVKLRPFIAGVDDDLRPLPVSYPPDAIPAGGLAGGPPIAYPPDTIPAGGRGGGFVLIAGERNVPAYLPITRAADAAPPAAAGPGPRPGGGGGRASGSRPAAGPAPAPRPRTRSRPRPAYGR